MAGETAVVRVITCPACGRKVKAVRSDDGTVIPGVHLPKPGALTWCRWRAATRTPKGSK